MHRRLPADGIPVPVHTHEHGDHAHHHHPIYPMLSIHWVHEPWALPIPSDSLR